VRCWNVWIESNHLFQHRCTELRELSNQVFLRHRRFCSLKKPLVPLGPDVAGKPALTLDDFGGWMEGYAWSGAVQLVD